MATPRHLPQPQIELIPLRSAVALDQPSTLDVLVRIVPPAVPVRADRPALNLGLVIDRSGSMQGAKIAYARQAACFAIEQLLPTDRVSVTIFDDRVEVLVPSTAAAAKGDALARVSGIMPGGSTALHEGWRQGGMQVSQHLLAGGLNRVLVLSDGLANVGETNPDRIATDVHGLAAHGVSTSTMGVGNDYNEDLMEAMARSGGGNYYYIESPEQLPRIFEAELRGLMATAGAKVSLGVEGLGGAEVLDVFNDYEKTATARCKLPNLRHGHALEAVVRLRVPALSGERELLRVRLAFDVPGGGERQVLHATLPLPAVPAAQLSEYVEHPEVRRQVTLLMTARARQEAVLASDRGDRVAAQAKLSEARAMAAAAPAAPALKQELAELDDLAAALDGGDTQRMRKAAKYQTYQRQQGM